MENWVKKFLKISLKTFLYKFVYCAFFRKKKKKDPKMAKLNTLNFTRLLKNMYDEHQFKLATLVKFLVHLFIAVPQE